MDKKRVIPRIVQMRRNQKILNRQIESRTAELEKINESLRAKITEIKGVEQELNAQLQAQTDELRRVKETLLAKTANHARTEDALDESERRYHVIADATPVLIWQSGADKLCTYFNSGWPGIYRAHHGAGARQRLGGRGPSGRPSAMSRNLHFCF
jgi:PAS domain-containing protein